MEFSLQDLKNSTSSGKNILNVTNRQSALELMKKGKLSSSTSKATIEKRVNTYTAAIIDETTEVLKSTTTDLVFIIDRSGSTNGLEGATCAGYNALINNENKSGFNTNVTTVLFSDLKEVLGFRIPARNVLPLSYSAFGGTALYSTLVEIIKRVRISQVESGNVPTHTLVYIMTDGEDNTSNRNNKCGASATLEETRELIKTYTRDYGWHFLFLGSFSKAKSVAESLGIDYNNAVIVDKTMEGAYNSFVSASQALNDLRTYGKISDS